MISIVKLLIQQEENNCPERISTIFPTDLSTEIMKLFQLSTIIKGLQLASKLLKNTVSKRINSYKYHSIARLVLI